MNTLRRAAAALMMVTVVSGFSLAPAWATAPAPAAQDCRQGIYNIYDRDGVFVGVLWVKRDCSSEVIWA
jgi:hypothetical protein